jgi:ubiquinone/menaquinone biosynthesis C-methylase UbiE
MRSGTLLRWHALKKVLKSEIKNGSSILDIGGYDGFISYMLCKHIPDIKVVMVDLDESGLELARDRGLNIINSSALELPINDCKFDVALCLDLIEHTREDERLIKEISRVLKKGGKLLLTTPMENGVCFPLITAEKSKDVNMNWGHVVMGYELNALKQLLENNDLSIVSTSTYFNIFSKFAYLLNLHPLTVLFGKVLFRLTVVLEPYIKYKSDEHIIVAIKN